VLDRVDARPDGVEQPAASEGVRRDRKADAMRFFDGGGDLLELVARVRR